MVSKMFLFLCGQLSQSFHFSLISETETHKTIISLKSKAIKCDDISRQMIIIYFDGILPIITHIINSYLSSDTYSILQRRVQVLPLPKINNPIYLFIVIFLGRGLKCLNTYVFKQFLYFRSFKKNMKQLFIVNCHLSFLEQCPWPVPN